MTDNRDFTRRHFLTAATAVTGGVGLVAVAVPFVASFAPSARAYALGAPVEVDISKVEPGAMIKVVWRGRVIMIVHRTDDMLTRLATIEDELADPASLESEQPQFATNPQRSLKPEILVVEGVCTHLGCVPIARFEVGPADLGSDWPGGFFCPCHGSKFDLAGRIYSGFPAPTNLRVPPHSFVTENIVLIGADIGAT
ncbi:MAG: ubiquinol-cytochrome c reductase iron-sulfur subunit [Gammaproteobacteria bacterium]|nr:MAG: ubiquinol-cytochrome c reductase iron-sulfur subunit [Gammaproteobacteria bacterium]